MPRQESQYGAGGALSFISENFGLTVVIGLFFLGGFFFGSLWTENQMLKQGSAPRAAVQPSAGDVAADPGTTDSGPTADQLAQTPPVTEEDHIRGNADAQVVLVEYSDYECPFCGRFHTTMQQVMDEYGDQVAWVYRDYPLAFHPNAQKAAEAGECVASLAGNEAFWTYTDSVFETNIAQGNLSPDAIAEAAASSGVDMTQFQNCLDSGEFASEVTDEMNAGSAAGVAGTPGTMVVVDGEVKEMIPGALPFAQVKAIIDQYL